MALLHSPRFQEDHRDQLTHDWAHVPIPRQREVLARLVELGRWRERDYAAAEWGPATSSARTGDLYLSDTTFFANVPERVWSFELGGYAVLKKWLGYRQAEDRDGKPLSTSEAQHFRSMIQRLAALLALHPKLDVSYEETAGDAFTAEELGLRKSKTSATD